MKLTAAKCPNCNADIEVNETLDKAICQYCGSTILIESAIQKHKMEITGTIKIDGIQSDSEKIEIIINYLKIGNLEEATTLLENLLEKNPFNEQALSIFIQIKTAILNNVNEEIKQTNPLLTIFDTRNLDDFLIENNADEQVEKLQTVTPSKYSDIISEYYQTIEKTEYYLKRQKLKDFILKIIIISIFLLLLCVMCSV